MSRKHLKTTKVYTAQSLAADFTTDWFNISQLDNAGFLIATSDVTDNVGTFAVEVKIQQDANNESPACALTLSSVPTLADADTEIFIDLNNLPATHFRLAFTAAGSTPDGTCEVWVHTKSVGA